MSTDPTLFSPASRQQASAESGSNGTQRTEVDSNGSRKYRRINVWLFRIRALLFVTLCATFGVLLTIVPWTPKWMDNALLVSFPDLRNIVASGFVRGTVSGLGILNLWVGFWEAIHYHEPNS